MKTLIIEDEANAAHDLAAMLQKIDPTIQICAFLDSVETAIEWLRRNTPPDLIFMDIQLADGVSFEILREVEISSPVIFCTAYDEYALQAFRVNSIDYLLKPLEEADLKRSLDKLAFLRQQFGDWPQKLLNWFSQNRPASGGKSSFLVSFKGKLFPVQTRDIAYFIIEDSLSFLITFDGRKLPLSQTLDVIEEQLDPRQFYRANRQYIIAFEAVKEVEPYFARKLAVKLRSIKPETVFISREKSTSFLHWLENR
ncbi:LytR/AlgR family response regulator transcription factor [Larkinella sp. VNQ87]|uniref:LytR/AlgR family response regulator transcription factor n=1 Tax=Larkinella sp. VNQ87 TaxID=3400921 RepID=UPI003C080DF4